MEISEAGTEGGVAVAPPAGSTAELTDLQLLRYSLSWFGLAGPESEETLSFDWDRQVLRLLRAIVDQSRRARSSLSDGATATGKEGEG